MLTHFSRHSLIVNPSLETWDIRCAWSTSRSFDRSSITLDRTSISKDLPRTCFMRMQNREAANNADFCSRCAVPCGDKSNLSGSNKQTWFSRPNRCKPGNHHLAGMSVLPHAFATPFSNSYQMPNPTVSCQIYRDIWLRIITQFLHIFRLVIIRKHAMPWLWSLSRPNDSVFLFIKIYNSIFPNEIISFFNSSSLKYKFLLF